MIQRKKKLCKGCNTEQYIFGRGLCIACYKQQNQYKIRKVSINQQKRNKKYKEIRDKYLLEHPVCEHCNTHPSEDIHHKKGRDGNNLYTHFLAVCRACHQFIEQNPEYAKEKGYSISRISKET